jgi:hypothetical protein
VFGSALVPHFARTYLTADRRLGFTPLAIDADADADADARVITTRSATTLRIEGGV